MTAVSEAVYRSRASSLALRYALRELRGGLRGFYVFIACIALGVMAIAGVGSVAASLSEGLDARGPHAARRRRRLLADPARSQAGGNRLPARARRGFGRGRLARDGPQRRRQAGAGRTQGGRRQLPDARRTDARSQNADAGSAGRARRRVRRGGRFHAAGAARSQARRPRHDRQRELPDPQRGRRRAGQARRQCRLRPALPGQRSEPARHRPVAARQPGALDLPRETAGQCRRRARRHPVDRRARAAPCRKPAGRSAAAATPRRSSNAPSAASRSS